MKQKEHACGKEGMQNEASLQHRKGGTNNQILVEEGHSAGEYSILSM